MKLKLNVPKLVLLVALLIIGYLNITAMLWEGSGNSVLVSLGMLVVAGFGVFFLISKPIPKKSISLLLILYYLYIIIVSVFNGYISVFAGEITMIVTCAYWVFNFLVFAECGQRKVIDNKKISVLFFVLSLVCFALFWRYYSTNKTQTLQLTGLNVVYYFLFMLPIVLMNRNKKVIGIGIVINVFAVLLSSKRGALIIVLAALLIWLLTEFSGKLSVKTIFKMIGYVVISLIAITVIGKIVDQMGLDILNRMEGFISGDDSGGSGRTDIWTAYWEHMRQDDILHNLFGRGYNATKLNPTLKNLGLSWAHNDFLQILFDYGIVGFTIFLIFIAKLFAVARKMRKFHYPYYRQFLVSLVIFLLSCAYSMVMSYPQWFPTMAAFWGFVIGDFERERAVSS